MPRMKSELLVLKNGSERLRNIANFYKDPQRSALQQNLLGAAETLENMKKDTTPALKKQVLNQIEHALIILTRTSDSDRGDQVNHELVRSTYEQVFHHVEGLN